MKIRSLHLLIALIIFSTFFKLVLTNIFGIPNITSLVRDLLILLLFIYSLKKKLIILNVNFILAGFFLLLFSVGYLFISLVQNKFSEGVYFLRIFISPFLFFISITGIVNPFSTVDLYKHLRFLFQLNFVVLALSIGLYVFTVSVSDSLFLQLLDGEIVDGTRKIANAWTISGANFLRMGLPMAGPNVLAIYFVCNILLILALLIRDKALLYKINKNYNIYIFFNVVALILTFSRSGLLFLIVSILILLALRLDKMLKKVIIYTSIIIPVVIILGFLTDSYSEGKLSRWLSLTLSYNDPSLKGHSKSLDEPFEKFEEYYLFGYERATVGPRALLYTRDIVNVESSFFIVLYDMGVFLAIIFFCAYFFIIKGSLKTVSQLSLLIGLLINVQFLPNIIEVEVIMYFFLIFIVLGNINKLRPEPLLN